MTRAMLVGLMVLSSSAHAGEAEQVFALVRDSVVTILTLDERQQADSEGSGVIVAAGQVTTNCHVVQDATTIKVKSKGKEFTATLSLTDLPRDLCSLNVPELVAPGAKIRSYKDVKIGERVYAVGNPLGFELSVSAGLVSMIGQYRDEPQLYTSAALSPGSSGGGLFDAEGRLIGITTRVLTVGQNVNVAIPADWISELPRRGARPPPPATQAQPDPNWSEECEALRAAGKWKELLDLAGRWQLAYPTSTEALAVMGLALLKLDRPNEALDVLVKATQANPKHAMARGYLGLVRNRLGDARAAVLDLQAASSLQPSVAYYRRSQAELFFRGGQLDLALAEIREAIRFGPGEEANWQWLGSIRETQKQYEDAIKAYRTALRINPNSSSRGNLATCLAALGQSAEARETLARMPKGETRDALAWLQIGVLEHQKKRYRDAEIAYRKSLELNPVSAEAWLGLGRVLAETNRPNEAEEALRDAIKQRPDFGAALVTLGDVLAQRGDHAGAEAAYQKATVFEPTSVDAWRRYAYSLRDRRDFRSAAPTLEKVTQLDPGAATDWAMLGEARIKLQEWGPALAALQQAEKLDSKNELALQVLAAYYGSRGQLDQSLAYSEREIEINPASPSAWSNKGYSLLKLRRYDQAVEALQTAVRLEPDRANSLINLGETYLLQGQLGKAIAALERACTLAPNAVDAHLYAAQAYLASGQAGKAREHLDPIFLQLPDDPAAWLVLTSVYILQGKKVETLDAYARLRRLSPALARGLKEKTRGAQLPGGITLPD